MQVKITMNGIDITETSWSELWNLIEIKDIDGNIVIKIIANEVPTYQVSWELEGCYALHGIEEINADTDFVD
jgi:hypothetical protein